MKPPKNPILRKFFFKARGDSPFVKTVIHLTLLFACFIMSYPVLRVITVSLRSGDRLLNTSLDLIPTDRIRVPKGFTEAELFVQRERPLEDIVDESGNLIERGIKSELDIANRRRSDRRRISRDVTMRFSNKVYKLEVYEGMTDRELEQILYRGPQRIQDVMDAEIAKRHEFTEALITFEDGDTRTLRVPTGVTPEMVKQQVENQFAENIYGGRLTAEWLNYTDPELQQRLEAARPEYERLTASSDPEERGKADPALGVQLSLLNQVKGLVKKGNIKVNNQVFYEGFIPNNIDLRGVQTQLLYIVEQAPTISYWTATFSNYLDVLTQDDFFLWIWNSLLITVSTAFLGVALSSTGAYAFSRFEFPGRKAGLIFLLTTQMIPAGMLMLPIWIIAFNLGLIGQWSGLVLAYSVGSIPFSIWILKGYYDTIPKELEEAAIIDGATKMQTFFLIMLPLAAPALAIVFLFNFMNAWNDYLLAKIMIENRDKYTWPLGLERMQGQFNTKWGAFAAAAIMVSVPVVILFLSSSKYLVSGLTLGSVKG